MRKIAEKDQAEQQEAAERLRALEAQAERPDAQRSAIKALKETEEKSYSYMEELKRRRR